MSRGRWAGVLTGMLAPVLFLIALSPGLTVALFARASAAVPFAPPALATDPLPRVLAMFTAGWPLWPSPLAGGLAAGLAAWLTAGLVRLRQARPGRIVDDSGELAAVLEDQGQPPAVPLPAPPPPVTPPAERMPAQGADLAARARFVAMSFAFPDSSRARPELADWPLRMDCRPLRFTVSLHHAALAYRLEFCNRGAEALCPLMIRADLTAGESRGGPDGRHGFDGDTLPLCHYIDSLPAGDTVELSGEVRLPLAGVAAMRLGTATLLVPVLRLCAESAADRQTGMTASAGFAIGLPPLCAGGGIQPFRLDAGPGIWRKLSARRLAPTDHP